jgi:glycogen debranching enzyme
VEWVRGEKKVAKRKLLLFIYLFIYFFFFCRTAFLSIDLKSGKRVDAPLQISNILALYGGCASDEQASTMLQWIAPFCSTFCAASLDPNSSLFSHQDYWRGPIWINTNWLLSEAIETYYLHLDGLVAIRNRALLSVQTLVEKSGFFEYFDPTTGVPHGSNNFSWTAALYLDVKLANHSNYFLNSL